MKKAREEIIKALDSFNKEPSMNQALYGYKWSLYFHNVLLNVLALLPEDKKIKKGDKYLNDYSRVKMIKFMLAEARESFNNYSDDELIDLAKNENSLVSKNPFNIKDEFIYKKMLNDVVYQKNKTYEENNSIGEKNYE